MIKTIVLPSREDLRNTFDYREDGELLWKKWGKGFRGRRTEIAGDNGSATCPYRKVSIDGGRVSRRALLHRLIWVWHYGDIPEDMCIDHINRDKRDNRIENLRVVSFSDNQRNTPRKNKTGLPKHVFQTNNGKFSVVIKVGTFPTIEEAKYAANWARENLHHYPAPPAMLVRGPIS